jgi:hypothetical protein
MGFRRWFDVLKAAWRRLMLLGQPEMVYRRSDWLRKDVGLMYGEGLSRLERLDAAKRKYAGWI